MERRLGSLFKQGFEHLLVPHHLILSNWSCEGWVQQASSVAAFSQHSSKNFITVEAKAIVFLIWKNPLFYHCYLNI